VEIVDIKNHWKLTHRNSNNPVVLVGKLLPSVDYFWKLINIKEKVATGTSAVWFFPVQST
jgi:hypothetical protein